MKVVVAERERSAGSEAYLGSVGENLRKEDQGYDRPK